MTAILRLKQERQTAVVLVDNVLDPSSGLGIPAIRPVDPEKLTQVLHRTGFPHIFTKARFMEQGPALLAHIGCEH
jgi:hypothetical protein